MTKLRWLLGGGALLLALIVGTVVMSGGADGDAAVASLDASSSPSLQQSTTAASDTKADSDEGSSADASLTDQSQVKTESTTDGPVESGSVGTGIKVHGHWTIDVINPDGALVARHEFDNAITTDGTLWLAETFARGRVFGPWSVVLQHATTNPCLDGGTPFIGSCILAENPTASPPANVFDGLTVQYAAGVFTLSGFAVAAQDGDIGTVSTTNFGCGSSTSPSDCGLNQVNAHDVMFTTATLGDPVSVVAGQQIQVTVDISFN